MKQLIKLLQQANQKKKEKINKPKEKEKINKPEDIYIPPEKRQQIIDDLKLF